MFSLLFPSLSFFSTPLTVITSMDTPALLPQRTTYSLPPPDSISLPLLITIPTPTSPSLKRMTTTKMRPISKILIIKSSKPSKTQDFSTSMPLARSIQSLSTSSLRWIHQSPPFQSHSLLYHPFKSLASIAQSQTTSSLVPSAQSSAEEPGPGSSLPSEGAMSSNIDPSINTPPTTLWEEAPQSISNDAQIGSIPQH